MLTLSLALAAIVSEAAEPARGRATLVVEYESREALDALLAALERNAEINVVSSTVSQEREVVRKALEKPVPVTLTISFIAVRYDADGRGVFRTDSGSLWRETVVTPKTQRLRPGQRYTGVITRSVLGGFRLNVEGVVREFKVEPIQLATSDAAP